MMMIKDEESQLKKERFHFREFPSVKHLSVLALTKFKWDFD